MAKPATTPRPIPRPTQTTKPFWEAAKKKKLVMQWDPGARRYQFLPRAISIHSGKQNLQWREVSGKGAVHSFTIAEAPAAGFEGKTPYVIAMVELDEGVRIMANLIKIAPDQVEAGMRVKLAWEKLSDEINFYVFEPA